MEWSDGRSLVFPLKRIVNISGQTLDKEEEAIWGSFAAEKLVLICLVILRLLPCACGSEVSRGLVVDLVVVVGVCRGQKFPSCLCMCRLVLHSKPRNHTVLRNREAGISRNTVGSHTK